MNFTQIGKPIKRYDAAAKVTGKAKYTGDFHERDMLIGKIYRSTIAHGYVKNIDVSKAKALPGVEAVITFKDVPDTKYPTAGHPYTTDPKHQDIADRQILTSHVRYYGDEIAAVVAENELIAKEALRLIKVDYEELPVILTVEDALAKDAPEIHKNTKNIVMPVHKIRVIKPYIGGGFGAKQDVCIEPLNAALTMAVGGRPVLLDLGREESIIGTRVRHAVKYRIKTGVTKNGKMIAREVAAKTAKGGYASHGISPIAKQGTIFLQLYPTPNVKFDLVSVYSNAPAAGAMRGYGVPQIKYALESHIDDVAAKIGMDPTEFRKINNIKVGDEDPKTHLKILTCGLNECIDKGKKLIKWDEKRKKYTRQSGDKRRGVGMAEFCYGSGTYPVCLEIAGARIMLRPDGSIFMQVGATEIGQGSDTAFSQMAADIIGISPEQVYLESTTDTDSTPFDTGAYASRQTYVSGSAVKKAAVECKNKILEAVKKRKNIAVENLDIKDSQIIEKNSGKVVMSLAELALDTYYNRENSNPITVDVYNQTKSNALAFGVTFAEIEVDIKTGKIDVLEIYNIHDSGTIINRQLAVGQVHGGISMGLGYALTEELKIHPETGKPLNNNLLDYKIPTMMDTPKFGVDFVETYEPTGPFGNKSLGEPPAITPAPAIRNAVLNATGVAFTRLPMNTQRVFEKFKEEGLI